MVSDKYVDAESRAAVSHVEPQSHGGSAAHPTRPTDSGCRGSCTDTYVSIDMQNKRTQNTSTWRLLVELLGNSSTIMQSARNLSWVTTTCLSCRASVNAAPELASDSVLNSQSGSGPRVAMVTEEQQQQFVQQMLQALANTNHGVSQYFPIILLSASVVYLNFSWIWNITRK